MSKCNGCVWSDKISNELVLCMFPNCVIKDTNKNKTPVKAKKKRKKVYVSY
jgi:hypothetical protein